MNLLYNRYNEELRYKILVGLCTLLILVCSVAFTVNYTRGGFNTFALIDLFLVGMYSVCLYFIRKDGISSWNKILISYSYILVIIVMTSIGKLNAGLLNWIFTIPLMFYILFSKKHAFITSLMVMFYEVFNLYYAGDYGQVASFVGLPNFFLAYSVIWLLANLYVTQNSDIKQKILVHATKDSLTGAFNRLSLKQRIEYYVSDNPVSICLIDVDLFKKINDKFGHDIGDKALVRLVELISQNTSESQVYRVGGEEFVILFNDRLDAAIKKSEDILSAVNTCDYQGIHNELSLSFSGGVVELGKEESLSSVLKRADKYLYQAKDSGRNKIMSELNHT